MADDKVLNVGEAAFRVVERAHVTPCSPSLITESRLVSGVVYVSLAETVIDGANPPEAQICTRLRMDLISAQILRDTLDALINEATQTADAINLS